VAYDLPDKITRAKWILILKGLFLPKIFEHYGKSI
jgi:hypothetical protein